MDFEDIYELLESVRMYRLRAKERIIPTMSVTGAFIGYATADGDFPSVTWTIPVRAAKASASARGTRESVRIRELLASYMGRRQLLEELRTGTLEYGVARTLTPVEAPPEPSAPPSGLVQLQLPL